MQSPSVVAAGPTEERSAFHRHFYRGVPYSQTRSAEIADASVTDDMEAETAYCLDRFKSYDPSTGTYLGYDGYKHACP